MATPSFSASPPSLFSNQRNQHAPASAPSLSFLQQLSCDISVNVAILASHIQSYGLLQPGFGIDAPLDLDSLFQDPMAQKARKELANLGKKLCLLMLGPAKAQGDFHRVRLRIIPIL